MADPVFTTREAIHEWEQEQVRSFCKGVASSDAGFMQRLFRVSNQLARVRAAHAHLLTQESDNG